MKKDELLYQEYLNGEKDAADKLVLRYADSLILYINNYIGDYHEAEDLMIEAFARIFAKRRPIRDEGCFKAYLYKIGRNLACRHKKKVLSGWTSFEQLPFEICEEKVFETHLFQKEQNRRLYCALNQIKKEYREALYLVYFEGLNYAEAALVMGKSVSQITNLVCRGKKRLKVQLTQEEFEYEIG